MLEWLSSVSRGKKELRLHFEVLEDCTSVSDRKIFVVYLKEVVFVLAVCKQLKNKVSVFERYCSGIYNKA